MATLIFIVSTFAKAALMWGLTLTFILINIFFERKVCALIQDRVGPNRAHIAGIRFFGFIYNFADAVKLLFKEDIVPHFVHKFYFLVAPTIIMTIALLGGSVIPFADDMKLGIWTFKMQVIDLNIGILFILAITSLSVYSIVLSGWGSNSKYPLFAAVRSSAQMISYEIAMGLSLVGLIMIFGTVNLGELVRHQSGTVLGFLPQWGIVIQPLGFLLFFTASMAELNRNPFDLPEGESEIVGFHIEYSSMKFALFFMGEYANIFVASAVTVTLFLGGWQIPYVSTDMLKTHAALTCQIASGAIIVAAIIFGALLVRFYKTRTYRWNDMRDSEPYVIFALLAIVVLVSSLLIGVSLSLEFNEVASALTAALIQFGSFIVKTLLICFTIVWIRWTLPRFRYDQLMAFGWKILLPLGILNLFITGLFILWQQRIQ
jgi:NADH-quinone oxidoreductase subunit H